MRPTFIVLLLSTFAVTARADDSPRAPWALLGGDIYWGGDSVAQLGARPRLSLRLGRVQLLGRGLLSFARKENAVVRPDLDGYLRVDVGANILFRRRQGRCSVGSSHSEYGTNVYGETVETGTYTTSSSYFCRTYTGIEIGGAKAQEQTLANGAVVGVPQVYAGVRGEEYYLDPGDGSFVFSLGLYAHAMHAMSFDLPAGYAGKHDESAWGARFGGESQVAIGRHRALVMNAELGFHPAARWNASSPAFRAFLSFGLVLF